MITTQHDYWQISYDSRVNDKISDTQCIEQHRRKKKKKLAYQI